MIRQVPLTPHTQHDAGYTPSPQVGEQQRVAEALPQAGELADAGDR